MHPLHQTYAQTDINHLITKQIFHKPCEAGLGFGLLWPKQCNARSQNSFSKNKSGSSFTALLWPRPAPTGPTLQNQGTWCWGGGAFLQYTVSPTPPCSQLLQRKVVSTHSLQILVPYCPLERRKKGDPNRTQMPYK